MTAQMMTDIWNFHSPDRLSSETTHDLFFFFWGEGDKAEMNIFDFVEIEFSIA